MEYFNSTTLYTKKTHEPVITTCNYTINQQQLSWQDTCCFVTNFQVKLHHAIKGYQDTEPSHQPNNKIHFMIKFLKNIKKKKQWIKR